VDDCVGRENITKMIAVYKALGSVILSKSVQEGEAAAFKPDDAGFYRTSAASLEEVMQLLQECSSQAGVELGGDVGVAVNLGANNYFVANTGENGTYTYKPEEEAVEADNWAPWIEQVGLEQGRRKLTKTWAAAQQVSVCRLHRRRLRVIRLRDLEES